MKAELQQKSIHKYNGLVVECKHCKGFFTVYTIIEHLKRENIEFQYDLILDRDMQDSEFKSVFNISNKG